MITITLVEQHKTAKTITYSRKMKLFHSIDSAKKFIIPVVKEMKLAKKEKREPEQRIDAVSFDDKSEKTLLLELGAIVSIENESDY